MYVFISVLLLVAVLVVRRVCSGSVPCTCVAIAMAGWLHGLCVGFVWVHVESFLHSVASPFHSFVTILLFAWTCFWRGLWCMRSKRSRESLPAM